MTEGKDVNKNDKPIVRDKRARTAIKLRLDPNKQEGEFKLLGGSQADQWNNRLNGQTLNALPIAHSKNNDSITEACLAVSYGVIDMAPADPVEGILIAQLIAANEAALEMYQKGWAQPPEFFEARTKYLQLADKAARTVMMLTERLDHHRGRGQQQITVKHVTTNNVTADQAIIADSVTTGGARNVAAPPLLAANSEVPMPILDEVTRPDPAGVGEVPNRNDHQPHAKRARRTSVQSQIETDGEALSCARGTRLSRLSNAWCPGRRTDRNAERELSAR